MPPFGRGKAALLASKPRPPYIAAMFIETETTPNPATLKFLPGQAVMPAGTRDFASPEDAAASPLAEALFDTGEVTGVFFGRDFVSVTAAPGADWSADLNCSYRRLHLPFAVTPSTQNKNGAVSTVAKQIYSLTLMGRQPSLGPPSLRSY